MEPIAIGVDVGASKIATAAVTPTGQVFSIASNGDRGRAGNRRSHCADCRGNQGTGVGA